MKRILLATFLLAFLLPTAGSAQNKIAIAAHRGYWDCPEAGGAQNSIASLKKAQDFRCWGSEFDVHLTSDNVVVVNHDPSINGKEIQTNTYAFIKDELLKNGETISTLDDYLTQGEKSKKTILVLELKKQQNAERESLMTDLIVEALKQHGLFKPKRVMFISFSMFICEKIAREYPTFINQYLNGDVAPADLKAKGINGLDYHYKVFRAHPEWVKEAHDLGMSVNVWTVNKEKDIKAMIDLGVDCITTNDPALVRKLLGKRENQKIKVKLK